MTVMVNDYPHKKIVYAGAGDGWSKASIAADSSVSSGLITTERCREAVAPKVSTSVRRLASD